MDLETILTLVAVGGTISGIVIGWAGRSRATKQDVVAEASRDAAMRSDVEYIKRGVDDLRLEQRSQGQKFDALSERVTRTEESLRSVHKRMNRLDGGRDSV